MKRNFIYTTLTPLTAGSPSKQIDLDRLIPSIKNVRLTKIMVNHHLIDATSNEYVNIDQTTVRWFIFSVSINTIPTIQNNDFEFKQGDTTTIQNYLRFHLSDTLQKITFDDLAISSGCRFTLDWNKGIGVVDINIRTTIHFEFEDITD
jgi:hypothetical protein